MKIAVVQKGKSRFEVANSSRKPSEAWWIEFGSSYIRKGTFNLTPDKVVYYIAGDEIPMVVIETLMKQGFDLSNVIFGTGVQR